MKQAEIEAIAKGLNENQKYALRSALCHGVERAIEERKTRLLPKYCTLDSGYRSNVAAPTRRSLVDKGLAEGTGWYPKLTRDGVKVANIVIEDWLADYEERESFDTEAPGVTFKPKDVWEYVRAYLADRQRHKDEHAAKVKRAARLWRGLSTDTWQGRRAISTQIKEEFEDGTYRSGLKFDLDELIDLGEQITAKLEAK